MPRRTSPPPAVAERYPPPHADWLTWLDGQPAQAGPKQGEPINRRRVAERIDRSPDVISRWATGDRTDLQVRDWAQILSFVMEEIGGTHWPPDVQRAVYWGGPELYLRNRRYGRIPMAARRKA